MPERGAGLYSSILIELAFECYLLLLTTFMARSYCPFCPNLCKSANKPGRIDWAMSKTKCPRSHHAVRLRHVAPPLVETQSKPTKTTSATAVGHSDRAFTVELRKQWPVAVRVSD